MNPRSVVGMIEQAAKTCPRLAAGLGRITLKSAMVAVVFTAGCGSDDRLKTFPVTGNITFSDGRPFAGGSGAFVVFESFEHGTSATGAIDADGCFQLGTFDPGDGAVAGRHRVSITPPMPSGDPDETQAAPPIHPKFRNLDTSGLEVTVDEAPTNNIRLTVQPP